MPDETKAGKRPHRERAHEIPIRGRYVALAMEVRRALGWLPGTAPFISTRAAEAKTGLTNNTIARMAGGDRVKETTIRAFAQGMGVDAAPLLRRAGYAPMPSFLDAGDPLLAVGEDLGLTGFDAVPLSLDMASAGESLPAPNEGDQASVADALPAGVRAIRVRGDCMEPFYHEGDILLVRPTHYAENGQVVIARLDGEIVSVKVFRNAEASGPFLESAAEPRVRITAAFEILGVVEGYTRLHGRGKANGY